MTKAIVKAAFTPAAKQTVKKGQTFNQICPFTGDHTGQTVEVMEVKPAANGKPAALVRIVSGNDIHAIGYEFGVYITSSTLEGYEEDIYSVSDQEDQEPEVKTFKNVKFTRTDECTNIVFCQSESAPADHWEECKESEIKGRNCSQLYVQDGVRYYGYL